MSKSKYFKWERPIVPSAPKEFEVIGTDDDPDIAAPASPCSGRAWEHDVSYTAKTPEGRKRVRVRLGDQDDVAKQLRLTYGLVLSGAITAIEGSRRSRLLASMGQVLSSASLEKRLARIERALERSK